MPEPQGSKRRERRQGHPVKLERVQLGQERVRGGVPFRKPLPRGKIGHGKLMESISEDGDVFRSVKDNGVQPRHDLGELRVREKKQHAQRVPDALQVDRCCTGGRDEQNLTIGKKEKK